MLIWRICPQGQANDMTEDRMSGWAPLLVHLQCFSDPSAVDLPSADAMPYAIFLSLTGRVEEGFALAERLQRERGPLNIIFTADCPDHAFRAMQCHASGYLIEPLRYEEVFRELSDLRYDAETIAPKRIRIRTFGNFDVWVDGNLLHFPRANAKQLLAYLVDRRGGSCTLGEIAAVLWEDRERSRSLNSQIQTTISTLNHVLQEAGVGELLIRSHNAVSIRCEMVSCDLYDFLEGKAAAVHAYLGEYMRNYSWAEYTAGWLNDYMQHRRSESFF